MGRSARIGRLVVGLVLGVALVVGAVVAWRMNQQHPIVPGAQRCVATANGQSVSVNLDQAHYAAIIAGVASRRGLAPRAASIALATAYQESGIRNLDYGDRDSVGLFQQRPSMGWGTAAQLQDPYYASAKFYVALVKIHGWQADSINDVAQKVQRSGHPEAYRDHERDARILASVLTGHSPGGLTCLERTNATGDADGLRTSLDKTLGVSSVSVSGARVVIKASSTAQEWAVAHHAVANSGRFGVAQVTVGDQTWKHDPNNLPSWQTTDTAAPTHQVVVMLR